MGLVEEKRINAAKSLSIADQMLMQTFNLIKDPKILIAVLEHVYNSIISEISALINFEKERGNLDNVDESSEGLLYDFKTKLSQKYDLMAFESFIDDIVRFRHGRKEAPTEFSRKTMYVVCSNDYECESISKEMMKEFIKKAKLFIERTDNIIAEHERILN